GASDGRPPGRAGGHAEDDVRVERVVDNLAGADVAVDAVRIDRRPAVGGDAGIERIVEQQRVVDANAGVGKGRIVRRVADGLVRIGRVEGEAIELHDAEAGRPDVA